MPDDLRVLLDTNLLVSGLLWPLGAPSAILQLASDGQITALVSAMTLAEFDNVIGRAHLAHVVRRRYLTPDVLRAAVRSAVEIVEPASVDMPPNLRDPNDLHVLVAGGKADAIVTGDQDLLALGSYEGIPILTPAAFLERFPPA